MGSFLNGFSIGIMLLCYRVYHSATMRPLFPPISSPVHLGCSFACLSEDHQNANGPVARVRRGSSPVTRSPAKPRLQLRGSPSTPKPGTFFYFLILMAPFSSKNPLLLLQVTDLVVSYHLQSMSFRRIWFRLIFLSPLWFYSPPEIKVSPPYYTRALYPAHNRGLWKYCIVKALIKAGDAFVLQTGLSWSLYFFEVAPLSCSIWAHGAISTAD